MSDCRPLLVTSDPLLLDDLLRLAAAAGVEVDVAHDVPSAVRTWGRAPLVLLGEDLVAGCARSRLPRRAQVVLLGRDLDDAGVWQRAVEVGAEHVVFLPDAEPWLATALAEAVDGPSSTSPLVAVLGGRGGGGATVLACALAVSAVRRGLRTLLVDGDPLGGGIDLVFGAEQQAGLRWPDSVRPAAGCRPRRSRRRCRRCRGLGCSPGTGERPPRWRPKRSVPCSERPGAPMS